ncbi:MAG: hypothetical protein M1826_002177 [Phylliscum demangeonii]|nr:MAG: hypothetical protein M1826_002177 [Phylliscum demangeonii]
MRLDRATRRTATTVVVTLLLGLPTFSVSQGGVLDAVPQCYQDCIRQTGSFTCNGLDVKCLCRLSNGNFLTNLITCVRSNCDSNLNTTALVEPVSQVCAGVGVPIAPAVVANAENIGASLAAAAGATLTAATTITSSFASAGTAYIVAVPLSPTSGPFGVQTVTGVRSTISAISITGWASPAGSGSSSTASASSSAIASASAVTTTMVVTTTSVSSAAAAATDSSGSSTGTSTTTSTTTTAANAANSPKPTSSGKSGGQGNGNPFSAANDGASVRAGNEPWLAVVLSLAVLLAWI